MKKLFLAIFLSCLMIPAFSLSFEASYIFHENNKGFNLGVSSNNPVFNTSFGLYYETYELKVKRHVKEFRQYVNGSGGNYYDYYTSTYKKSDTLIGPYFQFGWSILPIKIGSNIKLGFNTSFQIAATYSSLGKYEIPLCGFIGLQGKVKKIDVLGGFKITVPFHLLKSDKDFTDDGRLDRTTPRGTCTITLRYNFKRKTQAVTQQKQSHTHIINGAKLKPSL